MLLRRTDKPWLKLPSDVRSFEERFPERFIENGITEQDMVSTAGGLALQGLLPVVNTFAAFLAARANEQIYNNACERSKVIYVCHYAGLIPAGPGASHQSLRDISLLGELPGFTVIQPCNGLETRLALGYCVDEAKGSCVLRLNIGPSPREIVLPEGYKLVYGQGVALTEGEDFILFAYGPVMLHEALLASELLAQRGLGLKVINMPWLNRSDLEWLSRTVSAVRIDTRAGRPLSLRRACRSSSWSALQVRSFERSEVWEICRRRPSSLWDSR